MFEPAVAQVEAGVPVVFANRGGADHTVTFRGIGFDATIPPGGSATHVFPDAGRFEYVCKLHPPDMRGVVIVIERPA